MATFVYIHGGGGSAWDAHLVSDELRRRGHAFVAVDLPIEDESAGLENYADTVAEAASEQKDDGGVVLVAHSLGGFAAPLVCERIAIDLLVYVSAMVASPGEAPQDWWGNTGHSRCKISDDPGESFFHDVPPDLVTEALARERDQQIEWMARPWPLLEMPAVPTRFVLFRDDRFFPPEFMRPVVADRLGVVPDEVPGGHCAMLSRPTALADMLDSYV